MTNNKNVLSLHSTSRNRSRAAETLRFLCGFIWKNISIYTNTHTQALHACQMYVSNVYVRTYTCMYMYIEADTEHTAAGRCIVSFGCSARDTVKGCCTLSIFLFFYLCSVLSRRWLISHSFLYESTESFGCDDSRSAGNGIATNAIKKETVF